MATMFDYKRAIKFSRHFACCLDKKQVDHVEIVNEAYLLMVEDNGNDIYPYIKEAVRKFHIKEGINIDWASLKIKEDTLTYRCCLKCGDRFPLSVFRIAINKYRSYCPECYKEQQKEYYRTRKKNEDWYKNHLAKTRLQKIERYNLVKSIPKVHEELKKKQRERAKLNRHKYVDREKKYRNQNKAKLNAAQNKRRKDWWSDYMKEYRAKNAEAIKEKAKLYRLQNKEKIRQRRSANYYAKKHSKSTLKMAA